MRSSKLSKFLKAAAFTAAFVIAASAAGPLAGVVSNAGGLPSKYESPYKTPVMDQKDNPLCWAYSTVDMLNISAVKQGFAPAGTSLFSAPAFARSIYTGEEYRMVSNPSVWYKYSGDLEQAITAASVGKGLIKASSCPDVNSASKLGAGTIYGVDGFVEEFRSFDIWEDPGSKVRIIKEWVTEFGSVGVSVFLGNYDPVRGLASTKTWDYTAVSHSILIVGWDDSKSTDTGTGAFLIKNTWGEGWGSGGYAYISYRADLGRSVYAAKASLSYGRKVYTHTEIMPQGGISGSLSDPISAVNVYRPSDNMSVDSGVIYTGYPASLTVRIWKTSAGASPQELSRKPDSEGTLGVSQPGIYTVSLAAPVNVKAGETVIAEFIVKADQKYMVYTEGASYYPPDWNTTCSSGETYLRSGNTLSEKTDNYFGAIKGKLTGVKPTEAPTATPAPTPVPTAAPTATPKPSETPTHAYNASNTPGSGTPEPHGTEDQSGQDDEDDTPGETEEGWFIEIPTQGDYPGEEDTQDATLSPEELDEEFHRILEGLKKLAKIVGIILLVILALIIGLIVLIVRLVRKSKKKKSDS